MQLLLEIVRIYECLMREAYTHTHTKEKEHRSAPLRGADSNLGKIFHGCCSRVVLIESLFIN